MSDVTYTSQPPALERNGGRPLQRRRPLPGGRAVVGGFLVALAAVGVFAAYTDATSDHRQRYVVAQTDLPLGHRISPTDLAYAAMDLPPLVRRGATREPSKLVGAMVIGPVNKGELIQASAVVGGASVEGRFGPEISVPVESARALSGQLKVGELIDVLATYETGAQGNTVVVVRNARVVNRSKPGGALSDSADGKEVITLSVSSSAEALAVAHAATAGTITLVRSAGPQSGTGPSTYQTPTGSQGSTG